MITESTFHLIGEALTRSASSFNHTRVCELGNQWMMTTPICSDIKSPFLTKYQIPARQWYESKGLQYVSIDTNGKDGALRYDLELPLPLDILGQFDIVTNFGTLEHISDQRQALQNIHNLLRIGGLVIHVLPMSPDYDGHGLYTYTPKFLQELKAIGAYYTELEEVVYVTPREQIHGGDVLCFVLSKQS